MRFPKDMERATKVTKKRFGSVWYAIEDSAVDAASKKLCADLANEVIEQLRAQKLPMAKAAELLGVTQSRIADLMRGRLDQFSLDALADMADRIGLRPRLVPSRDPVRGTVTVPMMSPDRPP